MEIKEVIGIDVSKLTLDCCIHTSRKLKVFGNNFSEIHSLINWVSKSVKNSKDQILFVFEHTGLYSDLLANLLSKNGFLIHLASGLEIKRSMGITRGKDDKTDAKRIATYGYRLREEINPTKLPSMTLVKLKRLMSMRKKLVMQRAGHMATIREHKSILKGEKIFFQVQQRVIAVLTRQINTLEKEMDRIILEDPELESMLQLLVGVKGIGKVTARFLIVYTVGFTAFDTWRKFASYCGIAPFPYRSGTSIRGRTKVSRLANMEGKSLMHLCATSAIQCNPEMKAYYERRLKKGKNKMSTLNIIRNKLLARAFAVISRGTPYVNTMKYAS